jgi:hypothetical protein
MYSETKQAAVYTFTAGASSREVAALSTSLTASFCALLLSSFSSRLLLTAGIKPSAKLGSCGRVVIDMIAVQLNG